MNALQSFKFEKDFLDLYILSNFAEINTKKIIQWGQEKIRNSFHALSYHSNITLSLSESYCFLKLQSKPCGKNLIKFSCRENTTRIFYCADLSHLYSGLLSDIVFFCILGFLAFSIIVFSTCQTFTLCKKVRKPLFSIFIVIS